tara:strand:- start:16587 stop:16979 length:393 start_codon:yes stop_codon:yes gene_type:complete
MPRKPKRSTLIKKADTIFSQYIRQRYANDSGIAECFTCGKKDHWKNLQCGHFMSRKHYSTRWDETNCQVQCAGCNVFRYGEQYKFGRNLDIELGNGTADSLEVKSRQIVKYDNFELLELINHYKKKLAEL